MQWRLILMCWLALLECGALHAQPVVTLDTESSLISLAGHTEWLRDPSGQQDASQAASADGWQSLQSPLNAGFTKDAVWLRWVFRQPVEGKSWRLQVDNTLLEHVALYQRDAAGAWRVQRAGRAVLHSEWPYETRSPVFAIDLPPGSHDLMLRVETRNSLSTSIHLWERERFYSRAQSEAFAWGIYFGLYALVILIQFLFWKWTRESLCGWYVLYAGLNCLSMLLTMGYLQNALNWSGTVAVPLLSLAICASIYAATKFTVVVLELHQHMPHLNRLLLRGAAAASSVCALIVLIGPLGLGTSMAQILSVIFMITLAWASVALFLRRGELAERFVVVAFGVFCVGVFLRYLRNLGWLPPGPITDNSVQVASVLHMIVMCVFIVYRYNAVRAALQVEQAARQEQRDFVAMVSHEFRTPLAIIDTSAQQLSSHLDAPAEKSLKRCTNIREAARRMSNLMDNYLTFERMGHFEKAVQARPSDIHALLKGLVAEWPDGRVQLTVKQLPEQFSCDPDMLRVALRNLLSNADRHAFPDTQIALYAQGLLDGQIRIRVANEGRPIPKDEVPLLFHKYYRGREAIGQPGAGLGLFLVQRIVHAHNGRVTVGFRSGITSFQIVLASI